jgi:hypothetical protein
MRTCTTRKARAPGARPDRWLRRLGARLVEACFWSFRRTSAIGCFATHHRSREARSTRSSRKNTGTLRHHSVAGLRVERRSSRNSAQAGGEKIEVNDGVTTRGTPCSSDLESATFKVAASDEGANRSRNPPAPYTTSKLQQDATNLLHFGAKRTMQIAQAALRRHRSEARRWSRRSHHLHAYRLDARQRRRGCRSPRGDRKAIRQGVCSRQTQRIQNEEKRAGRARSDSTRQTSSLRPDVDQEAPEGRAVQALQAHLESLRSHLK